MSVVVVDRDMDWTATTEGNIDSYILLFHRRLLVARFEDETPKGGSICRIHGRFVP